MHLSASALFFVLLYNFGAIGTIADDTGLEPARLPNESGIKVDGTCIGLTQPGYCFARVKHYYEGKKLKRTKCLDTNRCPRLGGKCQFHYGTQKGAVCFKSDRVPEIKDIEEAQASTGPAAPRPLKGTDEAQTPKEAVQVPELRDFAFPPKGEGAQAQVNSRVESGDFQATKLGQAVADGVPDKERKGAVTTKQTGLLGGEGNTQYDKIPGF